MGRKGPSRHLKRELSPSFWPIHRKEFAWTVRTKPGPHPLKSSIPLTVVVRDALGYAETNKEAKMLIKQGKILVDGRARTDERHPVGIMDVISLPDANQVFRILPTHGGRLRLHPINNREADFKLCRIMGKNTVRGGMTQLILHDSRSLRLRTEDRGYGVNDVLQIKIPEQEVQEHIRFEEGVLTLVTGGASSGKNGVLVKLGTEPGNKRTATVRTKDGEEIRTLASYIFALGSGRNLISLPGDL